jgi:hypothetical protein
MLKFTVKIAYRVSYRPFLSQEFLKGMGGGKGVPIPFLWVSIYCPFSNKFIINGYLFIFGPNKLHRYFHFSACPFTLCRGFFTPKMVGAFYMQGYKVKEKTAIVPQCTPSFKTQWAPCF